MPTTTRNSTLALFASVLSTSALAQEFEARVVRELDDTCVYTIDLNDPVSDGPISVGYVLLPVVGINAYAIRLDSSGVQIWDWVYFTDFSDTFNDIAAIPGGDIVIVGETNLWFTDDLGMTLTRVNPLGVIIWSHAYQSTQFSGAGAFGPLERGNDVATTFDDGFIMSSRLWNHPFAIQGPVLTKVDSAGSVLWANYYSDSDLGPDTFASFNDVKEIFSPGEQPFYVAAGYYADFIAEPRDSFVALFDSSGNWAWSHTFGFPNSSDQALGIVVTSNNDIVVAGEFIGANGSSTATLMRLDFAGNLLWQRFYPGFQTDGSVVEDLNGQLVMAGTVIGPDNSLDAAMLMLTPSGLPVLAQAYGGQGPDLGVAVDVRTSGTGFVLAANSTSFSLDQDFYLLGTDSSGRTGCERPFEQPSQPNTPVVVDRILCPNPIPEEVAHPLEQRAGSTIQSVCPPCPSCAWDFAPPLGAGDFSDVIAFLTFFGSMDACADLAPPVGAFDFSDVIAFLNSFAVGCP